MQETLASFAQTDKIKIKWPNDILVVSDEGSAKLVGISLEMIGGKLCCGIGINITSPSGSAEDAKAAGSTEELAFLQHILKASMPYRALRSIR